MIRYHKKIFFFRVFESWFNYEYRFSNIFSLNVFMHVKNSNHKKIAGVQNISHTIELDLEQDTNEIFSNFSKQVRQQVKIAENEGTRCYFHQEIDRFADFFNDFAMRKDTYTTSKEKIMELGNSVKLSFAENKGEILAAHSYLVDEDIKIVRHLHSATKRLDEHFDRNFIGRANKFLTVKDILYFKEMGFKIYDFGGYAMNTEDESLKGINNYKLLFGGKVVPCINYYSYSYWFLKKLSKLLGLSGKL
ncbi:MAG: hypothetical protein ABI707_04010 [Ferruginibacter sp.]